VSSPREANVQPSAFGLDYEFEPESLPSPILDRRRIEPWSIWISAYDCKQGNVLAGSGNEGTVNPEDDQGGPGCASE